MNTPLINHSKLIRGLLVFFIFSTGFALKAQPGTLDSIYGTNGTVITYLEGNENNWSEVWCSALDMQGRLVVGGQNRALPNNSRHAFFARYNTDGSLDSTFGDVGYVIDTTKDVSIFGMTVTSDNKVLACGYVKTTTAEYSRDYIILRYNENGTIDDAFGEDGKVMVDFGGLHRNEAKDINEQSDGKILVNGNFSQDDDSSKIGICRLLPNGVLDSTYGTNGLVSQDINSVSPSCNISKIDADGKLVVAGRRGVDTAQGVISRYNTDGSLDSTFGIAGLAFNNIPHLDYGFYSVAIAGDGSIYTCGTSEVPISLEWDFVIAKFTSSGMVDSSFANDGFLHLEFTNVEMDEAHDLVVQQDGKLLVTGQAENIANNNTWEFATIRLNQNGSIDSTFGENGLSLIPVGSGDAFSNTIELLSDGKVLLAGSTYINSSVAIAAARILTSENVGIVDLESNKIEVLLYPNPIVDKASLNYELLKPANITIELLSLNGKSIRKIQDDTIINSGKHKIEVNLSSSPPGIYLLKLTADGAIKTIKLIKL